VKTDE